MGTPTTNYDLIKDDGNEFYDVAKLNINLDKIDAALKANKTADDEHKADIVTDADGAHGLKIESGSWTPVLEGAITAGSPTYTTRGGAYTKIGRVVTIHGRVDISSKGGLTGVLKIAGLPFVGNSGMASQGISIGQMSGLTFGVNSPTFNITAGQNSIIFTFMTSGSTPSNFNDSNISDSFNIRFSATYMTN